MNTKVKYLMSNLSSFPSKAMAFLCLKLLLFFSLINQFLEAQTLTGSNLDQPLFPFGSHRITGSFSTGCNRHESTGATTFTVLNNCSFTVWAAAVPGGGRPLRTGEAWSLSVGSRATGGGRVWGRTNCLFDASGRGRCQTGDCGGVLACETYGSPPNTVAEFSLDQSNRLDYFDVSVVDGFNIPMEFRPRAEGCRSARCAADINGQCPAELRAAGGCNNPCAVFKTNEYCCVNSSTRCGPTSYSEFFKDRCPNAYSYPMDDTSIFSCATGTDYDVVFCPS